MPKTKKTSANYDYLACCFQGGGALGAYQVGVLEALQNAGYEPDWFVGTSIGAINAAIAAGNEPKKRIEQMKAFWNAISTPSLCVDELKPDDPYSRKVQHYLSSQSAMWYGQPGFFVPRVLSPLLNHDSSPDKLSYYDTSPLRDTLEKFIDFDRINNQKTRLSVGAVEVVTGQIVYFDSEKDTIITPEHIMASGALPPGFPAVSIDGVYFWDGGLSSNSPVTYVLKDHRPKSLLCFLIHLFDSLGLLPASMDDVEKRKKDIEFSSKFTKEIGMHHKTHELRYKIHQLSKYITEKDKKLKIVKDCLESGWDSTVSLARFLYQGSKDDLSSKDYEFSSKSIQEHMHQGYEDGRLSLKTSPWLDPVPVDAGIALHDMSKIKFDKE